MAWLLVSLMAATGLYCLARCRVAPGATREERRLDASAGVKAFAMALMAVPFGLGRAVPAWLWVLLLVPAALWSLVSAVRSSRHRRHHLEHVVGHLAMVYMVVAMAGSMTVMPGMADMGAGAGLPWLTGALLVFFVADAVFNGLRVLSASPGVAGAGVGCSPSGTALWGPRMPDACHLTLALGMAVMLIAM